jgi:hypothetical protein
VLKANFPITPPTKVSSDFFQAPQSSLTNSIIGIPNAAYRFQTLGNAVSFISALIAALLYGNIGIKIFYSAVMRDVFKLPPLESKRGKILWVALGKHCLLRLPHVHFPACAIQNFRIFVSQNIT